jgi:hypothetical protein
MDFSNIDPVFLKEDLPIFNSNYKLDNDESINDLFKDF